MKIEASALVQAFQQLYAERTLTENGLHVQCYFDTADVRAVILGAHAYYDGTTYLSHRFADNNSLVWSLVATGHLRPIRLLAPHQAELLTLIQYSFHRDRLPNDNDLLRMFHTDAEPGTSKDAPFIDRVVVATKTLAAAWLPWKRRLGTFVRDGTIDLETMRHDVTILVQSPNFHELYDRFESRRPNRPVNNFADAAALVSLLTAADSFRRGESHEVPLFYSSSALFGTILQEAGLREKLVLARHDVSIDTLCSSAHLILRTVFAEETSKTVSPDFADMIAALAEAPLPPGSMALDVTDYWATIKKMFGLRLYKRVLMPALRTDRILTEGMGFSDLVNEESQQWVEEKLKEMAGQLRRNTAAFRRLRDLWIDVSDAVEGFVKRNLPSEPMSIDGLLRFSFSRPVKSEVRKALKDLRSGDRTVVDAVAAKIFKMLDAEETDIDRLTATAALLWVLRLDRHLSALLHGKQTTQHHSLQMLLGASQLRSRTAIPNTKAIVERLRIHYDSSDLVRKSELAIGIAYLDFRLAKAAGFVPSWQAEENCESFPQDAVDCMSEAIELARVAAAAPSLDRARRAYATNQYLYYLVAENKADDSALRLCATKLVRWRYEKSVWQPRFDDTIARYFHLRAHRESSEAVKKQLLSWALHEAGQASSNDPDDDHDIKAFHSQIKIEYDAYRSVENILLVDEDLRETNEVGEGEDFETV